MGGIDDAVAECLEQCKDSAAPAVVIESYCRQLLRQPGWKPREVEQVQLLALDEALRRLRSENSKADPDC